MRKLGILIALVLFVSIGIPANAATTWSGNGIVTDIKVDVIDNANFYQVDFTIETQQGVLNFNTLCGVTTILSDVMSCLPIGSKYHVQLVKISNEWQIKEFSLIQEGVVTNPITTMGAGTPAGIYYNYNATDEQWFLYIDLGVGASPIQALGKATKFLTGEFTADEVNARIDNQLRTLFEDWQLITGQLPEVDGVYQRIEVVGKNKYLVQRWIFFGIHFYSLDNPSTPESELRFTTIFSFGYPLPEVWW